MDKSIQSQLEQALRNQEEQVHLRDKEISKLWAQNVAMVEVVKVAKDAPTYLDWLVKLLREANEHPKHIRAAETLADNLRYTISAAERITQ